MKDRWSGRQTLALMIAGTAIGFILWLLFLDWLWPRLAGVDDPSNYWTMVAALSSAMTAAALIGGGFVAYRQLIDTASTRYIDVADRLFGELNSQDNISARGWIFRNLNILTAEELEEMAWEIYKKRDNPEEKNIDIEKEKLEKLTQKILTDEGQKAVKRTLNSLDRVAFLTQSGWIPEELIMPWMNPMVVKSWLRLKPYVESERMRRDEPDYYEDAGKLGDFCVVWRIKEYGKAVSRPSPDAI